MSTISTTASLRPRPVINRVENSGAEPTFSTNGDGLSPDPAIEIASLAVPEPPAWAMMVVGFAGFGFVALRRPRRKEELLAA
jgi:hypothetical protein